MKRERQPTPQEFEKLLAWFDSDRDKAGQTFNLIHCRLIRIFASRGCVDAEALADEVVNRVATRIDKVIVDYNDPLRCCLGFVENVYREDLREQQMKFAAKEPPAPRPSDELEREDRCLEKCLENLVQSERDLFMHYFQGEKRARINRRRKLADGLAVTLNALRIRAHHLRKEMHQCMVTCMSGN